MNRDEKGIGHVLESILDLIHRLDLISTVTQVGTRNLHAQMKLQSAIFGQLRF